DGYRQNPSLRTGPLSPAIAKTSEKDIVVAARRMIRARGVDALTLRDVAEAVGIRAPSLYKRFKDKAALLQAVKTDALGRFEEALRLAAEGHPPPLAFIKLATAYRDFGRRRPEIYRLIHRPELKAAGLEAERTALVPVVEVITALVGSGHALAATRCATSFLHGFVALEIENHFQDAGSTDEAFTFSVYVVLQGLVNSAAR
ncbi:MAG: TetR/AcrR family transcriptional regulator, partial [Hyphomicrobiales bacterium]|nr:TetR/AcrR family transcriptional regulator [Hyphomicrobiales bacterium]